MVTTSAYRTPLDVTDELAGWQAEREALTTALAELEAQLPAAQERAADAEHVWNLALAERLAASGEPVTNTRLTPLAGRDGETFSMMRREQPNETEERAKAIRAADSRDAWDGADASLRRWRGEATALDSRRSQILSRLLLIDGRIAQLETEYVRLTAHADRRGRLLAGLRERLSGGHTGG